MRGIGRSLWLLLSRSCSKDVVLLPFVHLYSTLLPQVVGDRLKPHQVCVTGISPLRGSLRAAPTKMDGQEYHDCLTGSLRDSLVELFYGRMGTAVHLTLAVFYAGAPAQVVLAHPPKSLPAFWRAVRERISVAGCDRAARYFSKYREERESALSLCRQREGAFYKVISKIF
mgnify:CR=1 FL=1